MYHNGAFLLAGADIANQSFPTLASDIFLTLLLKWSEWHVGNRYFVRTFPALTSWGSVSLCGSI